MSILNYFFIGTAFTFVIDLLLGMKQRILCILIWPLAALVFTFNFIKQLFK